MLSFGRISIFILCAIFVIGFINVSCSRVLSEPKPQSNTPDIPSTVRSVYDVDISRYRLTIDGLVDHPVVLTYNDLTHFPQVTQTAILACPGVFEYEADWTGVLVMTLLDEAGIQSQATKVVLIAVDGYQIFLPLEEIQQKDILLAYLVNGQTLTKDDGYPLRLVAKGKGGDFWVRWIDHIKII